MTEAKTKHLFITTVDKASIEQAQLDWVWRLVLRTEIASFRSDEEHKRPDGSYFRADMMY